MTIDEQIKQKQQQINLFEELLQGTEKDTYDDGYYCGKIELLGEQIAELRRKQDKRKQPTIHY